MNWILCRAVALLIGFLGEQQIGWPRKWYHPIMAVGSLISGAERMLRAWFPKSKAGERAAGIVMASVLPLLTLGVSGGVLYFLYRWSWIAGLLVESAMCWSIFASGSLRDAAQEVETGLSHSVEAGRQAVSRIVGRDTRQLSQAGVIRAAVETVAENLSDGVLAPLVFTALGGAAGGYFYKTVNTMDSMVGYRNDRYRYFGTGAARLDDVCNAIPARLSAILMVLLAGFCGLDRRRAWRTFCRDRYCHASPNSAQTESVMAGALGLQLGGDAWYFGQLHKKQTIGDALRPAEPEDIARAVRLMLATSDAAVCLAVMLLVWIGG